MARVSLSPVGNSSDLQKSVQRSLSDLEDQLNVRSTLFVSGSKLPATKTGDVIFQTDGESVTGVKVRTGKDSIAPLTADTFGITLSSLGVSSGAEAQIRAGAITQTSLGITLATLGVAAGAITQITSGAITQASIGISAGAITQITAGAITLITLGVSAGAITQIAAGAIVLTGGGANSLGITANFNTQLTTGLPAADGTLCAVVGNYTSGNTRLRFRGYLSSASVTNVLTQDGDWGFWHDTGSGKTYFGLFEGATRRYVELNLT